MPLLKSWCLGGSGARTCVSSNGNGKEGPPLSQRKLRKSSEHGAGDSNPQKNGLGLANARSSSSSLKKPKWKTDAQYLLACLGSAVGLGNILRFPNMCYKYNGFGFLLPYLAAMILIGIPVLGMEAMFGQMTQRSAVKAFGKIRPFLWGLGAYVTWAAFMVVSYYNVIMAWSLEYLFYSFKSPLPWGTTTASARSFFFDTVLQMQKSDGELWAMEDGMGAVSWHLLLALLAQWLLIFFCVYNLTKTVQMIVMVTVPLPFLLIAIMAIYGLTRPGANDGVLAYVDPTNNPVALFSLDAWVDAAGQVFFGLSLSVGVMIAYSSHQPKENKVVRNSWIITLGNSMTSIVAGFAVFALLGHFAHTSGADLQDVANSGYILSFQTFPATFALFEGKAPQLFSILFFITLLLLGIDSAMSLVESVCEAFIDNNGWCKRHVPLVVFFFCSVGFLFSIMMATKSGYYILDILDHFSSNYLMLLGGGLSCIVIGWLYSAEKLVEEVKMHCGERAHWLPFLWTYLCKFVTPTILIVLFLYNFVNDCSTPYNGYPQWALLCFGWTPCLIVPMFAFGLPSLIWPQPPFITPMYETSESRQQCIADQEVVLEAKEKDHMRNANEVQVEEEEEGEEEERRVLEMEPMGQEVV